MSAEQEPVAGWTNGYAVFEVLDADGKVIGYELIGPDGLIDTFMPPVHTLADALARFDELSAPTIKFEM